MKKYLVFAVVLTCASPAFAADQSNFDLFHEVSTQVNGYAHFTIFDNVSAEVDDGYVILAGHVTMPYKSSAIEQRVSRVTGVRGVRNTITVLPVSSYDKRLRLGIARAIYSHPALSIYGHGASSSIHVIVEYGRVTLDGVVNNEADRAIATFVARSFLSFGFKNELKTKSEIVQLLEQL